jgi:hypothetical protein
MPVMPATQEAEVGGSWSKANQAKSMRPYLKNKLENTKSLVCGSSDREALSSIPSNTKKRKKEGKVTHRIYFC